MGLPEIIEIVPSKCPVSASITVPGSKSITNRALVLAALADGKTVLKGALWSEDTQVMVDCLKTLGITVEVALDPVESGNRTITVSGQAGRIPDGGPKAAPKELFVGNAGTAARFLTALVCLGRGSYRLSGIPRMHERPQAALLSALRELGYEIDSENDRLPAVVHATGPREGRCCVDIADSSQFASALLLCAGATAWRVEIAGNSADNAPYVEMTKSLIECFPKNGGTFQIEPDASGGSYFWGARWLLQQPIRVNHWPTSGWQIDARFADIAQESGDRLPDMSRETDLGDAIMTAIALAPFADTPVVFSDLGRLRVQECERVAALRTELQRCGAQVTEAGDSLLVEPTPDLHAAEIETYNDHRMAMCFAVLGLKTPGIRIKNPACVKKTFPNFFQKLAADAPTGLGIEIRDHDGCALNHDELFAG